MLYGEVFGHGVQAYDYGTREIAARAFDLMVDGRYLDFWLFAELCDAHGVARVPLVYQGPFSLETMKQLSDGPSLIGGSHGREGVVVRPLIERHDPAVGRVVLKYVGDRYLFGSGEDTTDI